MRLSWPQLDDNKRAILGPYPPNCKRDESCRRNKAWIDAFSTDVYLHFIASAQTEGICHHNAIMQLVPPCIPESISWNPCKIDSSNKDSVRYFERVVSDYLPMLDSDRPRIRKLLMQMAMSDDTDSSKAVLQSMLALATLHRDGQQSHAERLKLSAIRALLVSMNEDMDARAGIQHIAAGMLLCSFEVSIIARSATKDSNEDRYRWQRITLNGLGTYAAPKTS